MKKTLVLGASDKQDRFSYKAVKLLKYYNYEVVAIGNRNGFIDDIEILTEKKHYTDIHTVTLYLNPTNQEQYIDYILSLKPQRIIFNPGTENPKLKSIAIQNGIEIVENCTLVMLNSGTF